MATRTGSQTAGWMIGAGAVASLLGTILFILTGLEGVYGPALHWPRLARELGMAAGGGLAVLGILVALSGLALYVLLPAFSRDGRALRDYGSHRVVLACTALAAVAGNLLAGLYFFLTPRLVSGATGVRELSTGQTLSPEGIAVAAISLDVALLAAVYLRIVRPGAVSWQTMGLSLHGLPGRLLIGLLYGVLLFAVSSSLELLLEQLGVHQTQASVFQSVTRASPRQFGLVLLAGAVVAPIVEEIYFRGYVFRAYLNQKGIWQAFLFSAGLFALVHLDLPALIPIFAVGLLLSFLYHRTGSILPGIVAHAVNNAAAFVLLYLGVN